MFALRHFFVWHPHIVWKSPVFGSSQFLRKIKMSQCEHTHLAQYKLFCFLCKVKFCYPEILRVVGGVDTQKIKLLKLSWTSRFLLHNNYKLFCFYYKFIFCFPMSLRVLLILKNKGLVIRFIIKESVKCKCKKVV